MIVIIINSYWRPVVPALTWLNLNLVDKTIYTPVSLTHYKSIAQQTATSIMLI